MIKRKNRERKTFTKLYSIIIHYYKQKYSLLLSMNSKLEIVSWSLPWSSSKRSANGKKWLVTINSSKTTYNPSSLIGPSIMMKGCFLRERPCLERLLKLYLNPDLMLNSHIWSIAKDSPPIKWSARYTATFWRQWKP